MLLLVMPLSAPERGFESNGKDEEKACCSFTDSSHFFLLASSTIFDWYCSLRSESLAGFTFWLIPVLEVETVSVVNFGSSLLYIVKL